jgi:hypothetical protein
MNVIMERGKRLLKRKQVLSRNESLVLPDITKPGKQTVKEKPLDRPLVEDHIEDNAMEPEA